jgi:hypothetical protein
MNSIPNAFGVKAAGCGHALIFAAVVLLLPEKPAAHETLVLTGSDWPRSFETDGVKISVFQPQIESFDQDRIEARSAFSVQLSDDELVFGAMRYTARALTDLEKRLVYFSELALLSVKFPDGDAAKVKQFKSHLEAALEELGFAMHLDRFMADLDAEDIERDNRGTFNDTPPLIFHETSPAVLLLVDGDPILKEVEDGYYKYVVNTAYFIVLNPDDDYYYLKGGRWWYRSRSIKKGWQPIDSPPSAIREIADKSFKRDSTDSDNNVAELSDAPKIIVSTKPAELILTNGPPKLVPIEGTSLLYVDNTENDVLMDIETQQYYLLISGRWYEASALTGAKWSFVRPDRLPPDFAKIPKDSPMANVRSSVAGTREAKDALLETVIPQTAQIDRATATVNVMYDGDPKFIRIYGTGVSYAMNADKVVLKIRGRYYAVDQGIWFESTTTNGPWFVSTFVPPEVYDIPPRAPVYHVRYVYIYHYTPTVVYVGYTPGYYASYVYYGTVVYGTGYYYHPWYGVYYYPWPVTYGYGVHYNPYTGLWGYPVGVSYGWIIYGWFPYEYGYWGPSGYIYGYRHGYYHRHSHGYYHGYRNGYREGYSAGRSTGYRAVGPGARPRSFASSNTYRNRKDGVRQTGVKKSVFEGPLVHPNRPSSGIKRRFEDSGPVKRTVDRSASGARTVSRSSKNTPAWSSSRPPISRTNRNNVYADKDNRLYRRAEDGTWQPRTDDGKWQSHKNAKDEKVNSENRKKTTGKTEQSEKRKPAQDNAKYRNLDRYHQSRDRGDRRSSDRVRVQQAPNREAGGTRLDRNRRR